MTRILTALNGYPFIGHKSGVTFFYSSLHAGENILKLRLCASLHTCITFIYACTKVEFALEGSVDTGGPRHEFLRLLAEEIRDSDYFQDGSAGSFCL